ncbi:NSP2 protein [Rotavirus A]|uniref:Non-structural protein 2 n=1 Tax=Rotavirus A TaxID=28875 RepID=A0A0P0YKT1_9REOV|nr:NSP2 protein [Rotavirus A]
MAELACFCYPCDTDGKSVAKYNRNAIKCMLTAKIDKSKQDKVYNTIIYGFAPPPIYKKRFNDGNNSRGMNFDTEMYDKVADLIVQILNGIKIGKDKASEIMNVPISVRHMENLINRIENKDDVLSDDPNLITKAVLIAMGLVKEEEQTITAEGGEIVFQNHGFTMWKLDYKSHVLMPIVDPNFVEYKITLNSDKPLEDKVVKELVSELRWQYNKFAVITHGKGHYRVVRYSSVANHADRVHATYKSIIKKNTSHKFNELDSRVVWTNWAAFTRSMVNGMKLEDAKRLLFTKMRPNDSAFKGVTSERKIDEVSLIG